jgi:uncharacterized damage-inducible protein DinB
MNDFFKETFKYTYHFNNEVLLLLKNQAKIPQKSLTLVNHILNAHEIWNSRILGKDCHTKVWDIRPLENLIDINSSNYECTLQILKVCNLGQLVTYNNSRGESYKNMVKDILFHVINHSTYHRGQIATDCKLQEIKPLVSDYIFYKRE